jgi:hypothetical protein
LHLVKKDTQIQLVHGFLFNAHSSPRPCLPPDSIGPEPLLSRIYQAAVPQEKSQFVCNAINSTIAGELHLPILACREDHQPALFDWKSSVHHVTKVLHAFPRKSHPTDTAIEYQGRAPPTSDLVEIELSRKVCVASGDMQEQNQVCSRTDRYSEGPVA